MGSFSDLMLKAHFQGLKASIDEGQSGRTNNVRANQETLESVDQLINLLAKALATIEEAYEKDFELLELENATLYKQIVDTLNHYGYEYEGDDAILALTETPANTWEGFDPLPMEKAQGRKRASRNDKDERKVG